MKVKPASRWISTLLLVSLACWILSPLAAVAQETKPVIRFAIIAPENNCTVTAGEGLSVMVTTNLEDIVNLAILCDDRGIALLDKPPFMANLDTANLAPGAHILKASVFLKDGRRFGTQPITINVVPKPAAAPQPVSSPTPEVASPSAPVAPPAPPTVAAPVAPAVAPVVAPQPANMIVLKEGTPILLRTTKKLISGKEPEGSTVHYNVARDVLGRDRQVLVEYGAHGYGKVTESRKRGMLGRNGKLEFTVESVEAVDGTPIPLRGSEEASGKSNKGVVIATALLLTVLAVFVHGKDVTIPEGTEVAAYVDRDTPISASYATLIEAPRGVQEELVKVQMPEGSRVRKGEPLQVTVQPDPVEKAFRLRVVIAGAEKLNREKNFDTFEISTKDLPTGQNTLRVEVTFLSGLVVRQAVDFEVY